MKTMDSTRNGFRLALLLLMITLILRNAWMCDDAFITLRVVHNAVNGFGLRYNIAERVQAFTHPLWALCLTLLYSVTHEPYFSTVFLSVALSSAAFLIAICSVSTLPRIFLLAASLMLSKAFMDFTTSGLEQPLLYMFAVLLFVSLVPARELQPRPAYVPVFLFSLLLTTRMDVAPLFVPPVAAHVINHVRQSGFRLKPILLLCLCMVPFIAWMAFSTLYYGFPFPNTAYAKLGGGIERAALYKQGGLYFQTSLNTDPVTLLVIAGGIIAAIGAGILRWFGVGLLLQIGYVYSVGGDFMGTRFLSIPLLAAALVLANRKHLPATAAWTVGILLLLVGLLNRYHPLQSGADYKGFPTRHGIADERARYYPWLGLLNARRDPASYRTHHWYKDGVMHRERAATNASERVVLKTAIGLFGYAVGPGVHIVDRYALADPLLARLPPDPNWRIGHFSREPPPGYLESIRTGRNVIFSPGIRAYYTRLHHVITGPLFSWDRLRDIGRLNTGGDNAVLNARFFTPASFHKQVGMHVPDDSACSDAVLLVEKGAGAGLLAFGNYHDLPRGTYVASFRLKLLEPSTNAICRLEVGGEAGRLLLASREIAGADFHMPDRWQTLRVPFDVEGKLVKNCELRVYYQGNESMALDFADVIPSASAVDE